MTDVRFGMMMAALVVLGAAACHDSQASNERTAEVAKPIEIRLDYAT